MCIHWAQFPFIEPNSRNSSYLPHFELLLLLLFICLTSAKAKRERAKRMAHNQGNIGYMSLSLTTYSVRQCVCVCAYACLCSFYKLNIYYCYCLFAYTLHTYILTIDTAFVTHSGKWLAFIASNFANLDLSSSKKAVVIMWNTQNLSTDGQ